MLDLKDGVSEDCWSSRGHRQQRQAESGLAAGFATFVGVQQSAVTVIDSSLRSRALQGARRLAGEETTLEAKPPQRYAALCMIGFFYP